MEIVELDPVPIEDIPVKKDVKPAQIEDVKQIRDDALTKVIKKRTKKTGKKK